MITSSYRRWPVSAPTGGLVPRRMLQLLVGLLLLPLLGWAQSGPKPPTFPDTIHTSAPVQLVSCVAWQYYGGGQVEWITAREENSAVFEIEQSNDRSTWHLLSTMAAHPDSKVRQGYTYYDTNIRKYKVPVVYYRVRQVSQNGSFSYSPVRAVWLDQVITAARFQNH